MKPDRISALALGFLLLCQSATTNSAQGKDFTVVLSSEFCTAESHKVRFGYERKVIKDQLCPAITQLIETQFPGNAIVSEGPGQETATLTARVVAYSTAFGGMWSGSQRDIEIIVEWTLADPAGNPLWIETTQANAAGIGGNAFKRKRRFREDFATLMDELTSASEQAFQDLPSL